ncbi:MAG: winged helix-turn-helix domain-containing protein [Desulfovibrionaceae bacterium]|nr:winged helix-turn-helix domain-containing protein [Desulfovibrionaceae bacterium]
MKCSRSQREEDKILAFIAEHGHIARSKAEALLGVSQTTASRMLRRMVDQGLLYQDGRGKKTLYKMKA